MKHLVLLLVLLSSLICVSQQVCDDEGYREFDFWIGDWVVYTGDSTVAGYSTIELILDSCVIQESWTAASSNYVGRSLNSYDLNSRTWTQNWVDNSGASIIFSGQFINGKMEFSAQSETQNGPVFYKMVFTPLEGDEVSQVWEASRDNGTTWTILFNGVYRKASKN